MGSFSGKVTRSGFESHFLGAVIPDEIGGLAENSGTAATVVGKAGGVGTLVTGTSSGNRAQFTAGLNHKAEDGSLIFVARVMNLTAITNRALFLGFTDTVAQENPIEVSGTTITSSASDAVGFMFDTAATTDVWYVQGVKADTDTPLTAASVNGGNVVPTAGTYQEFRIEVSTDGDATFYIDGEMCGFVANCVTPTVLLTPIVLVEARTTAAQTVYVDYLGWEGATPATP